MPLTDSASCAGVPVLLPRQCFRWELKPSDPLTLASAAILLAGIALAASYFAARRAAGLDPMLALRDE